MSRLSSTLRNDAGGREAAADARWLEISHVIEKLSTASDVNDVAAYVSQAARSLVGADGVTFVLREGALCHYVEEDAVGPLWRGQRFPMSACISGWSMLNAATAIVPDVYADPRIPVAAYEPTFVRSLVMVPIGSEPLGAIGAYWSTKRTVDSETLGLLELLARVTIPAVNMVHMRTMLEHAEVRAIRAHEIARIGAWTLDTETCKLSVSQIFRSQMGRMSEGQFTYGDLINQLHPEDREALRASITNAANNGENFGLACRVIWADGSVHWLDLRADVLRDSRGVVTRLCGVSSSIDISSRGGL
jgi:PAS domain-containing protein